MNKKSIGELAEYVNVNFRNDSMNVSSGLDIISAALESIRENIIVQQDGLKKLGLNIEAGELDDFLLTVDDLLEIQKYLEDDGVMLMVEEIGFTNKLKPVLFANVYWRGDFFSFQTIRKRY